MKHQVYYWKTSQYTCAHKNHNRVNVCRWLTLLWMLNGCGCECERVFVPKSPLAGESVIFL